MLECSNVSITLMRDGRTLVENFNFVLNKGDKAVIIGEEGNGKSTLLRWIHEGGAADSAGYYTCRGQVVKKGRTGYLPQALPEADAERSVQALFGDIDVYMHTHILNDLRLPMELVYSEQAVGTLSGGEKVKVQLAKILMEEPDILLLDEPTNDIDIETLTWLEGFINRCKLPVLFVSHDETLIENTANVIVHIEQLVRKTKCRITVAGCSYAEYMSARSSTFDKQTQVARKQRSDHAAQMEKWAQVYNRVDHEQNSISRQDAAGGRLLKKKMKSVKSQEKRLQRQEDDFLELPQIEEAILAAFDEDIAMPRGKLVLDLHVPALYADGEADGAGRLLAEDVRLRVTGNRHVGIVGRNGTGKSTLLRAVWEALRGREDISPYYMPQDYAEALPFAATPVDFLAGSGMKADVTKARTYMGSMKLTHEEATGAINDLSGGQKAKLLFLDMVLKRADVLVLDEPTRNFSPLSGPVIRRTLAAFGGAIVSVSHDRKYLEEVCGEVYELTAKGLRLLTGEM